MISRNHWDNFTGPLPEVESKSWHQKVILMSQFCQSAGKHKESLKPYITKTNSHDLRKLKSEHMGTSNSYSDPPPLNPAAPVFAMPAQAISTANAVPASPTSQSLSNGFPKTHKRQKSTQGNDISSPGPKGLAMATVDESKLSGAELKKQKAAEKSARRKEKITEKGSSDAAVFSSLPQKSGLERRPSAGKKDIETVAHHKRTGSTSTRLLPVRAAVPATQPEPEKKLKDEKKVAIFSHLYSKDRRANIAGAGKEIHPAVLSLGLQLRDHVICGSNARCVAMLLVFKKVPTSIGRYNRVSEADLPVRLYGPTQRLLASLSPDISRPIFLTKSAILPILGPFP